MTLGSLRLFRLFSVLITGVLALPALAADRKPVPSPGAPTINKQSSLATRQASLNPNRQVTDASKRQIAGHRRPAVQIKQASALVDSLSGAAGFYSSAQETAGGERFAPNALTVAPPNLAGGNAGARDQLEG